MDNTSAINRNDNLQILRFVAAAFVLLTHITFYILERVDGSQLIWHVGEVGVPIFFVISGFVMHLSAARIPRNSDGARIFMHRRIARVFPLYWLITTIKLCIALIAPAMILHNKPNLVYSLASYVLFPMYNEEGAIRPLHGVAWTLLHEMLFYYIFALALVLRRSPYLFSTIVITAMFAIGLVLEPEAAWANVCVSSINLMFVVGMSLSAWIKAGLPVPRWLAWLMLLTATIALTGVDIAPFPFIRHNQIDAVLIVTAAMGLNLDALSGLKRLMIRLGDSSYSLYMLHPILAPATCVLLLTCHITSPYVIVPTAFVACVTAAHLLYLYIESPLNELARLHLGKLLLRQDTKTIATKGSS